MHDVVLKRTVSEGRLVNVKYLGGLAKNNKNDRRVVHTKKNINRRRRPNVYTSEGSPHIKISIVGDGPIDIHRRVVHI